MKLQSLFILAILAIGAILRFYKLDWGQGLFPHPDEYHIVRSISQLSFPNQMHPHFFSYGTATIYLIYFTQELINFLSTIFNFQFSIFNSFLIGRFYSALFSTFTIIVIYKICRSFMSIYFSYFAAFLVALTPGLIQQAHFATPESAQIFFLFNSLLFIIKFVEKNKILYLIIASIFFGLSNAVKISSIAFLLPLITSIVIASYSKKLSFKILLKFAKLLTLSIIIATATLFIAAPFIFLDLPAFLGNLEYEGALAIGKFSVFYTRQFINTLPIIFHAEKVLPYALGPSLFLFSGIGLLFLAVNLIKKPKIELVIIILAFLSLFLTNAFLFAKWTRFIAPTFPFFAILASFLLSRLYSKSKFISKLLMVILLISTIFWTISFFSIYTNSDIRITASSWLESNAKKGSKFLVEGGNTIDLPLKGDFQKTSLDFYALEENSEIRKQIIDSLYSSDYFLIQSRRVFMNHQKLPGMYPKTAKFYNTLFNGNLGFEQIKEFHSYPRFSLLNLSVEFPDETAEETWSVFDHPVIRVFMKTKQLSNYERFFEN